MLVVKEIRRMGEKVESITRGNQNVPEVTDME